jgi:hypothetical protein
VECWRSRLRDTTAHATLLRPDAKALFVGVGGHACLQHERALRHLLTSREDLRRERERDRYCFGNAPVDPEMGGKAAHAQLPLRTYRVPWADLLKKVFARDVLACPECGGRLRLIAFRGRGFRVPG